MSCVSLIHANTEFAKIELLIQADGCREPAWSRFGDLFEGEQDNWWKLNKKQYEIMLICLKTFLLAPVQWFFRHN